MLLRRINVYLTITLFSFINRHCVSFTTGLNCSQKKIEERNIFYWIANANNLIDPTTNSCSTAFLKNYSKYHRAIDSLGPYLWKTHVVNSSSAKVVYEYNSATLCYQELKEKYPQLTIAASGGISECWNNDCDAKVMGRDPNYFINSLLEYISNYPIDIDSVWIDFETKNLNANDTTNINALFDQLSQQISTYRYAGCVHNHEPAYLNETCKQFTQHAPRVTVQGAGTYWDNSPVGFEKILMDMISDIGPEYISRLSVAVCPDCSHYDQIDQTQLYERMDLLCRLNINSISAFTLDEILQLYGNDDTGDRWMKAFMYYKTGEK